jgi:hypothetical protein
MGDLFNWHGRFLQAFLTGLIFVVVPFWLSSGRDNPFLTLVILAATPFLSVMFGFVTSLGLERGLDVAQAVNYVGKTVFSRDAFVVGRRVGISGNHARRIGSLWYRDAGDPALIISSSAVAYRTPVLTIRTARSLTEQTTAQEKHGNIAAKPVRFGEWIGEGYMFTAQWKGCDVALGMFGVVEYRHVYIICLRR